jgi:hypothetical protein
MKGNGKSLKKGSRQEVESQVSLPAQIFSQDHMKKPECPVLPPLQSGEFRCTRLPSFPMAIAPTNR